MLGTKPTRRLSCEEGREEMMVHAHDGMAGSDSMKMLHSPCRKIGTGPKDVPSTGCAGRWIWGKFFLPVLRFLCFLFLSEQEGTVQNDYINSCSVTTDGNVVLTGATSGDWEVASSGDSSMVAVKLDVTDGTVLWRYQVCALKTSVYPLPLYW